MFVWGRNHRNKIGLFVKIQNIIDQSYSFLLILCHFITSYFTGIKKRSQHILELNRAEYIIIILMEKNKKRSTTTVYKGRLRLNANRQLKQLILMCFIYFLNTVSFLPYLRFSYHVVYVARQFVRPIYVFLPCPSMHFFQINYSFRAPTASLNAYWEAANELPLVG